MREMKDSGVAWIGEIPKDWEIIRFRYIAKITTGNQDTQDANPEGMYPFYVRSPIIECSDNYTFEGDGILMAGDGAGAGRVFHLAAGKYAVHQRVYRFYDFKYIDKSLLLYYLENMFSKVMDYGSAKTTVPSVRLPMIQNFYVCVPCENNQKHLVELIEKKKSQIDALIANNESQIEKLKQYKQSLITEVITKGLDPTVPMKDSGVEWIGEIPHDWAEARIKDVIKPIEREVLESDEIVTCFRDGVVTLRRNRREDGFTVSFTEHGYHGVDIGDLVIHGMDAFAGAIGCSDSRGKITPVVHVCQTIGNNRYFMYYLRFMAFGNILIDLSNGVRIRSSDFRNFARLGIFGVVVPPISEQDKIVDYLDTKCTQIDRLIAIKQAKIEKLNQYKKSLIYEYVTGKKEVNVNV